MQDLNKIYKLTTLIGVFSIVLMSAVAIYEYKVAGQTMILPLVEVLLLSAFVYGVHKKSFISACLLFAYFLVFRVCFSVSPHSFGPYLNLLLLFCFFRPMWFSFKRGRADHKELYCAK